MNCGSLRLRPKTGPQNTTIRRSKRRKKKRCRKKIALSGGKKKDPGDLETLTGFAIQGTKTRKTKKTVYCPRLWMHDRRVMRDKRGVGQVGGKLKKTRKGEKEENQKAQEYGPDDNGFTTRGPGQIGARFRRCGHGSRKKGTKREGAKNKGTAI